MVDPAVPPPTRTKFDSRATEMSNVKHYNIIRKVIDKVKMKENICVIRLQIKRLGTRDILSMVTSGSQ
jgi:hypothetical protein